MAGKNWNSKTRELTPVVGDDTKEKARRAMELKANGNSVSNIARLMELSETRIRELLK